MPADKLMDSWVRALAGRLRLVGRRAENAAVSDRDPESARQLVGRARSARRSSSYWVRCAAVSAARWC